MKNDYLNIMITHQTAGLLEQFKVNPGELYKLNEEQLKQVKQSFIENPGHRIMRDILRRQNYQSYLDQGLLTLVLSNIFDILSKKLPQEVNFNNSKLESVISRIKLVSIPKHIFEEPVSEEHYDE